MKSAFFIQGILILVSFNLLGESVTFVNKSGQTIEMIQAASAGDQNWSVNLIPEELLLNNQSILIDLIGESPWSFRFTDSHGKPYVVYGADPDISGKIVVEPRHLARLSTITGSERTVSIFNSTDYDITGMKISGKSDMSWGTDILGGRTIRPGETAIVVIEASPGSLNFDVQYSFMDGKDNFTIEQSDVILTDGASLVLKYP